jgi:hypothetical protein
VQEMSDFPADVQAAAAAAGFVDVKATGGR